MSSLWSFPQRARSSLDKITGVPAHVARAGNIDSAVVLVYPGTSSDSASDTTTSVWSLYIIEQEELEIIMIVEHQGHQARGERSQSTLLLGLVVGAQAPLIIWSNSS
jgi:hypothetical protein